MFLHVFHMTYSVKPQLFMNVSRTYIASHTSSWAEEKRFYPSLCVLRWRQKLASIALILSRNN